MKQLIFVFSVVLGVSACGPNNEELQLRRNPNNIKADDVVKMSEEAFGCEFQDKFAQAVEHLNKSELAAWAKIVNDDPWCFYSSNLKANQTWTVFQIDGSIMQIGQTTLAQYEADPSRRNHLYWTATKWGKAP